MSPSDFFPKEAAQHYDARNSKLADISNCLHFLTGLVLKDIPPRSRILCVGVGTGAEILSLAKTFPESTFLGLDTAQPMLDVCRERLEAAGLSDRCELFCGQVQELPGREDFDVAVALLVAHFVAREQRSSFYVGMSNHLRPGGHLVNAEISFDLSAKEFPSMLKNWEQVQSLMGGTPESLAKLPSVLKDVLTVLPPAETEQMLRLGGIHIPVLFFQALMIRAWYGRR